MSIATVPISESGQGLLQDLAEQTGQPMIDVLDISLDAYRRKLLLDQINAGSAALRTNPDDWAEHQAELRSMDGSHMDGLEERWGEEQV